MSTVVLEPRKKSTAGESFETIITRRLFEEGLVDTDAEARKAVAAIKDFAAKAALRLDVISVDDLLEEYEDMVLGRIMDEAMNDPDNSESVDESEIMEFLRQR